MARRVERVPEPQENGLQLNEDRPFHERFWVVERWAWVLFAIIILMALAGLTGGGGVLSRASATLDTGEVDYPRITRWESSDDLTVTFDADRETHRLTLGRPFSEYFEVEAVQPEPSRSLAAGDAYVMEFNAEADPPARVTLHIRPMHPGIARFQLGLDGEQTAATSVILP